MQPKPDQYFTGGFPVCKHHTDASYKPVKNTAAPQNACPDSPHKAQIKSQQKGCVEKCQNSGHNQQTCHLVTAESEKHFPGHHNADNSLQHCQNIQNFRGYPIKEIQIYFSAFFPPARCHTEINQRNQAHNQTDNHPQYADINPGMHLVIFPFCIQKTVLMGKRCIHTDKQYAAFSPVTGLQPVVKYIFHSLNICFKSNIMLLIKKVFSLFLSIFLQLHIEGLCDICINTVLISPADQVAYISAVLCQIVKIQASFVLIDFLPDIYQSVLQLCIGAAHLLHGVTAFHKTVPYPLSFQGQIVLIRKFIAYFFPHAGHIHAV